MVQPLYMCRIATSILFFDLDLVVSEAGSSCFTGRNSRGMV